MGHVTTFPVADYYPGLSSILRHLKKAAVSIVDLL